MFKSFIKNWLVFLCVLLTSLSLAYPVEALDFSNSFIRLSRLKTGETPTPILVVANTSESVIEDEVRVTAGSAWSISTTASDFTVSTSSLPSGITAWPGIATASGVSGNQITFPSGDISSGTSYGFYITGGIDTNPSAGTGANYLWNLASLVSSVVSSDSDQMIEVVSNDQVVVTGEVPAASTYFNADIVSLTSGTNFPQDKMISYQITYGSSLASSTPLTLQAEWSQGTIQGEGSATVDVLLYVNSSATDGYGSTPAVIDTLNRTITWTIPSFPASTDDETVTFSLITTDNYKGSLPVSFDVSARITSPALTSDTTVSQTYLYQAPTSTPTPTPTPTATPTATPTSTPTPTPVVSPTPSASPTTSPYPTPTATPVATTTPTPEPVTEEIIFENVIINGISNSSAIVEIITNQDTVLDFNYNQDINFLILKLTSNTPQSHHIFFVNDLSEATQYFFKLLATNTSDETAESDLYTFKTSSQPTIVNLLEDRTLITSDGLRLNSPQNPKVSQAVIPSNYPFEVSVVFENYQTLKNVTAIYNKQRIKLFEARPGIYVGKFSSTEKRQDSQQIEIEFQDLFGNLKKAPLFDLKVVDPFTVKSARDNKPIEKARIHLYKLNEDSNIYEFISPKTLLHENPLYTDHFGQSYLPLTYGKYRAEVSALGYQKTTVEFEISEETIAIGSGENGTYPTIHLEKDRFSLIAFIKYHLTTMGDLLNSTTKKIFKYSSSNRLLELLQILSLLFLAILIPLSFSAKTHISVLKLPHYLLTHLAILFGAPRSRKWQLYGRIVDNLTKTPIPRAQVILFDDDKQNIGEVFTDAKGEFYIVFSVDSVLYTINKRFYSMSEGSIERENEVTKVMEFELSHDETTIKKINKEFSFVVENILGLFFEVIIIGSIIMQISFIYQLGLLRVLPFLIISILNLVIWMFYLSSDRLFE